MSVIQQMICAIGQRIRTVVRIVFARIIWHSSYRMVNGSDNDSEANTLLVYPNTSPIQLLYAFFEHRPLIFSLAPAFYTWPPVGMPDIYLAYFTHCQR